MDNLSQFENEIAEAVERQPATLSEQLRVFERASVELRRRMQEERARIVSDFERRVANYEADVRAQIVEMKAAHEQELQAHDRVVKRFGTL